MVDVNLASVTEEEVIKPNLNDSNVGGVVAESDEKEKRDLSMSAKLFEEK